MGLFGKKKKEEETPVAPAPVTEEAAPAAEETAPAEPVAAEETAPVEAAPADAPAEEEKKEPELTAKEHGEVFHARMNYHAGYGVYKTWPNGGLTIHSGIGWFHPFGPSEYYGMACPPDNMCEEAKQFPLDKFFTDDWMDVYDTALFCIYRLKDGDIYAYDGIFCQRGAGDEGVPEKTVELRRDILTNVIVGGTGRYKGARGLMIGTAEGSGESHVVDTESGQTLPQALLKCLEGYIKIPTD